jgi:hypothetical protein
MTGQEKNGNEKNGKGVRAIKKAAGRLPFVGWICVVHKLVWI